MDIQDIAKGLERISETIDENREYLIRLDQQNGDGDLGISMSDGFHATIGYLASSEETDIGRALNKCGDAFNEAAPSSLGTIISFMFKGMARSLKGKTECGLEELGEAMLAGLVNIMNKAGSKPGEKTILDALAPGVEALRENAEDPKTAFAQAARAARAGSEGTKQMRAVWGRAAYYGEKSIGVLDGGSVVGALIFEALA